MELRFGAGIKPTEGGLVLSRGFELPRGERKEFVFDADLTKLSLPIKRVLIKGHPRKEKECEHGFAELTAKADDGTILYHQVFPFVIDGIIRKPPKELKESPYETAFGLQTTYAPLSRKLLVKIDRPYLKRRAEGISGSVKLIEPGSGKVVVSAPIPPFRNDYSEFTLDLKKLKIPVETEQDWKKLQEVRKLNRVIMEKNRGLKSAGKPVIPLVEVPPERTVEYTVEATLTTERGEALASVSKSIRLKGYQFEWLGNNIGISDEVIPPWTPIKWRNGRLYLWNKIYKLDGLGLAEEIINGGRKQLSSAMKLLAMVDGQESELPHPLPTLKELMDAGAELAGQARVSKLRIKVLTRVELDGFVLNRMRLVPESEVKVEGLSLSIEFPKDEVPCSVTTSGGWSASYGWRPEKWDSRETASGSRYGSFVPYVFLTDSERGFCWFADNDMGWVIDPSRPALELFGQGEKVVLRVNFVGRASVLREPRTIEYGWMVTPQKPQPPQWRAYHISYYKPYPEARCVFWNDADWAVLWPYYSSPYPWDYEKSRKTLQRSIRKGVRPCVGNIAHSIARYRDYKGRWFNGLCTDIGRIPGSTANGNVTRDKISNDFQLWHFERWVKLSGLSGIYFDENYLGEEWNYLTGTAYFLPDARIQPGYSYLGLREYNKRLRYMFESNGKKPPYLWLHTTSGQPVDAWMPDVGMEAENVEPTGVDNDYLEALPASRLRSIGMGRNLGCAPLIMCQSQRHWRDDISPFMVHQFLGWGLAHDCLPEGVGFWGVLASELEIWHDDINFLPYWKPGTAVEATVEGVLVSAHSRPRHIVLWVVNTTMESRRVRIQLT